MPPTDPANLSTVPALFEASVSRAPEAPMLHYRNQQLSYAEAAARVDRLAGYLAARGIRRGDRVAFWLPAIPAYLLLYLACARLGAIAVAVNTRYRAGEVGDLLHRTGSKMLILWPGFRQIDFAEILRGVEPGQLLAIESVLVYDEAEDADAASFTMHGKVVERYGDAERHEPYQGDASASELGCNIFTTSGTTSRPKLVVHNQRGITRHAIEVARNFRLYAPQTVTLQVLPLCGVFGFCQAMATIAAGRPIVMLPAFDADEIVRLCHQYRVTQFNATDDMVERILQAANGEAFSSIDFVGFAAFNQSGIELVERAEALGVRMVGVWGMSEMQALAARRDAEAPVAERAKAGGKLVSEDAKVRVRHPETGSILPPGVAGALEIRGPSLMAEYFNDPEETVDAMTEDGYFRTGDLTIIEQDGGFEFLSRMGDALRLGGFLVSPAEIDAEILACAGVEAAQTVAVTVAGVNRALSFVTLVDGARLDEPAVLTRCTERLAGYKCPLRVIALDKFPVADSPNGVKIQRSKLRQMAQEIVAEQAATN